MHISHVSTGVGSGFKEHIHGYLPHLPHGSGSGGSHLQASLINPHSSHLSGHIHSFCPHTVHGVPSHLQYCNARLHLEHIFCSK